MFDEYFSKYRSNLYLKSIYQLQMDSVRGHSKSSISFTNTYLKPFGNPRPTWPLIPPQTQLYPIFGSAVRQLRNARLAHTIVLFNDHCHCFVILSFCLALVTLQIQLPMRDKCARIIWTGMCGKRSLSPQGHALSDSRRESARWREVCGVGIQLILILVKSKCAEAGTKFIG